jgi:hypothetical protein
MLKSYPCSQGMITEQGKDKDKIGFRVKHG